MIAILEDEESRQIAMKKVLIEIGKEYCFFDNAPEMINWLEKNLEIVNLICLDHDLGPNRQKDGEIFDPGDGRDVVNFLISKFPKCPVIVHTSNYLAAPSMISALETSSWVVYRIFPFDNTSWIDISWFPLVQQLFAD
ncbi:MAG: cyclic-phosphate processing receiver domain-containing protein [Blastocatellia bacterium]